MYWLASIQPTLGYYLYHNTILKCRQPQNMLLIHSLCLSLGNTINRINNYNCFNLLYLFSLCKLFINLAWLWYLLALHHTAAAAAVHDVEINQRKSRGPFLRQQCATRLSVLWVGVWLIFFFFPWVEKFSSLALTISIVIAASAHMYSIHNWAACNKFMHVLQGPPSGILGNIGDNCSRSGWDEVGRGKVAANWKSVTTEILMCPFASRQTCRWLPL